MSEPSDEVVAHAERLAATTTLYDAYVVLCTIPDDQLRAVADHLGRNADGIVTAGAAFSAGNRATGFLFIENQDDRRPFLLGLLTDTYRRIDLRTPGALPMAKRLVIECAQLAQQLSRPTGTAAVELACRASQEEAALVDVGLHIVATVLGEDDLADPRLDPSAVPPSGAARAMYLSHHAGRLQALYEGGGNRADLDRAVALGDEAVEHAPSSGALRIICLCNQANRLQLRYEVRGIRADLDRAFTLGEESLYYADSSGLDWANHLSNAAVRFQLRYSADGTRSDLDRAIAVGQMALDKVSPSELHRAGYLSNQANRLQLRHQYSGDWADLEEAIILGDTALKHLPPSGPVRVGHLSNQAARLQARYRAYSARADLDRAITLGEETLEHAPPLGPLRAKCLCNQANRLELRYEADGTRADLDRAITLGEETLEQAPSSGPDRAGYLSNQANRLELRYEADGTRADLDAAIDLGNQALAHAPASGPDRAMYLSNQAVRLRLRYQADGTQADLEALMAAAREWAAVVAAGGGTRQGIIGNARWWMQTLCELANRGEVYWSFVADTGRALLRRAAQYATLPDTGSRGDLERDRHALSVRAAVDGILGVVALACVRSGDPGGAIEVLEDGAATIARDQASRIPWDLARRRVPELAEVALDLQARILHVSATGALEGLDALHDAYADAVAELRRELSIPSVEPSSLSELAERSSGPLVWVVATPQGGLALRLGPDGDVSYLELAELSTTASTDWHNRLHPSTDTDPDDTDPDDFEEGPTRPVPEPALRGPRGQRAPAASEVADVVCEVHAALGDAATWLDQPDTVLVPLGVLGGLPWQSAHLRLRLHLSATQATRSAPPLAEGYLAVYANPTGDLPGAEEEARKLRDNHRARPTFGPEATLASLAELEGCRRLHLAMHGTPDPALCFADEFLHLGNIHRLRHLWGGLDLAFLNCCTSAATLAGVRDESLGIATVALTGGARAALVALWQVDDSAAATFATTFHRHLNQNHSLQRCLAEARAEIAERHPATAHAYQLLA